ncbi:hypothetical protein SLS62_007671 [Diatrype stigma]|uniref:Uncharacterized protein n=1 Tax=Diatrype stigma TaxID=117547 RepID=A0AAN9UPA6_9PEZI
MALTSGTWIRELEETDYTRTFEGTSHWDRYGNIDRSPENLFQDEAMMSNTPSICDGKSQQTVTEHMVSPGFYQNATRFYHHISNAQGRRQLSRFPMVRALCDALNHAGYRAEMDDDGDIWYDCDDGDRYFDALEYHVSDMDEPDEAWFPRVCPICQDFEGYGLGDVLRTVESAKKQYYEYKEEVRKGKRSF